MLKRVNMDNFEKRMEQLKESKLSIQGILRKNGVDEKEIELVKSGEIDSVSFGTVKKLCAFINAYDNEMRDKAWAVLKSIKKGDTKFYVIKNGNEIKKNTYNGNNHTFYRIFLDDGAPAYGVYTSEAGLSNNIDSRTNTDDEILEAIAEEIWGGCDVEMVES